LNPLRLITSNAYGFISSAQSATGHLIKFCHAVNSRRQNITSPYQVKLD
jgi:hypothetical protein